MIYQVQIRGTLSSKWIDWFEGMQVLPQSNGTTLLIGELPDQAALHGLLQKIRDVGLTLLLVEMIDRQ